jgi:hypothetical protein
MKTIRKIDDQKDLNEYVEYKMRGYDYVKYFHDSYEDFVEEVCFLYRCVIESKGFRWGQEPPELNEEEWASLAEWASNEDQNGHSSRNDICCWGGD